MVEHALIWHGPIEPLQVEVRVLPEQLRAIGAAASMDFVLPDLHGDSRCDRFLGQTRRAYNQILCLLKTPFRISDKEIGASLATEAILSARVRADSRFLPADPQPHQ